MRCVICKKGSDEVKLFSGILESNMVMVCEGCADEEGIPVIKKPSDSQLDKIDHRDSVRERMERMSGLRDRTEVSEDQLATQGNLARLRAPIKKQQHEDVLDNYYWTLSMARRRKKLTVNHLAEKIQVSSEVIREIEKGIIPKGFEETFLKLEAYLGIKLLKIQKDKINFVRNNREAEKNILESVKEKMKDDHKNEYHEEESEENDKELEKLEKGDLDFSKKKDLFKITLSDLVDIKKKRDARISKRKKKDDEEAMVGDDLEIEEL